MKTNALTLNSPFSYTFPATAGHQHKRYQQINVPARTLVQMLRIDDAGSTMDRSQRSINETRAKAFADYLIANIKNGLPYIFPTVLGVIDTPYGSPEPQFYNAGDLLQESGAQNVNMSFCFVGALVVSTDARFTLFDGQHRSRGAAIALDKISKDKELSQLVDLSTLMIPVMAYTDLTLEERQIFFSDINMNMAKPQASIGIAYDHRDELARFAVEIAQELPFKGLVELEKNTIGKKSDKLFPLKTIKDLCQSLMCLGNKYTNDDVTTEKKNFVRMVLSKFSRPMGWSALEFMGNTAAEMRDHNIVTHTVMLKAMAEAAKTIDGQFRNFEGANLEALSDLDYGRQEGDFVGRCIDTISKRMMMNQTGIKLAANLLITTVGARLTPEQNQLEKQYFGEQAIEEAEIVEPEQTAEEVTAELEAFDDEPAPVEKDEEEDRAKVLNGDARSLVLNAAGTEEKKPNVVTRAAGGVVKALLDYEQKYFTSAVPLIPALKEKIAKVNEYEGNDASWKLIKSHKAATSFIYDVAQGVGTI
ncbi:DGQHR domain-containing protein [Vibrio europaeus]|uniref:DGQHR domain-containing protein n=1 Tax=Vibrio europaeus TaxID=300876 RepID=UPI00233E58ED|nr:DGQHR domain-containing protein [Vibrio europaeus]MDC5870240.1 DGQHR domain-containing protein [Vibrio europaeus]